MKKSLFVLGVLVLATVVLQGCGRKELPVSAKTEPAPAPAPAPAPVPAPKAEAVPAVEAPAAVPTPSPVPVEAPKPQIREILVADFNSGKKPNNIGGDFGAWNKDPDDQTQWCKESFSADEKYGRDGYSLQLDYDVDSVNPAYNGFWMKLDNLDATPYSKLVFYVKGDASAGCPEKFKIELKNAGGEVGKYYVTQISSTWSPVEVPFSSFQGIKDFSKLTELTVVFEDSAAKPKTGRIYIDNIGFAKD